jgi:hypothetical protein
MTWHPWFYTRGVIVILLFYFKKQIRIEVKTLTDRILCLCYNTHFYYKRVCKITIFWQWCIIRNFTLYINHVHSCYKSLLPPFPTMNQIPYMYLVFDLWKGGKCKYLECSPWLIVKVGEWFSHFTYQKCGLYEILFPCSSLPFIFRIQ